MASPMEALGDTNHKKEIVLDRIQKRIDERHADVQRKHEEKKLTDAVEENLSCFEANLSKEKTAVELEISRSGEIEKSRYVEHFDNLSIKLSKLQKYVSESTMFLPSYQITKAQQVIEKLQTAIQEKRDALIPKKKFAFKSKKTEKFKEDTSTLDDDNVAGKVKQVSSLEIELAACKFVNESGCTLEKYAEELNQKDVALADLDGCVIRLLGAPSAVHINKLKDCKIFMGPVSGSVFIRECANCTFVLPCQQLRVHTTHDTDFYIHVTSKAIIEDSIKTRFAPYNWSYPDIDEHYKIAGLNRNKNNWADVDDFNWLAADVHSPNWSVMAEDERQEKWN